MIPEHSILVHPRSYGVDSHGRNGLIVRYPRRRSRLTTFALEALDLGLKLIPFVLICGAIGYVVAAR